jgi:BirA family biotin operon repressor/biotin-[acetyl-CoA-carboxylase] ligase
MAHGTVILAEKQTAGRGQRGNTWAAASEKQFTASFYVETAFLSANRFLYVNLAAALAVREAVQAFSSLVPFIKWPNDLLVNDKKMGGILIEAQWQGAQVSGAIIGIGINLVPEIGLPSSCSLSDFCETVPPVLTVAQEIAAQLAIQFEYLRNRSWKELRDNYHRYLWKLGETMEVQTASGETLTGCITGIDTQGSLCFKCGEEVKAFGLREIRFTY